MERLGKWRDKGTGVNPFIRREERNIWLLLLGLIRLPPYAFFSLLHAILGNYYTGRLVLFLAGVKSVEYSEAYVNEDIIRTYSEGRLASKPKHHKGDLIFCNSVCWLDRLILSVLFPGGIFMFPEGCFTNNRGVLKLQKKYFENLNANSRVRLVGLKYDPLPSSSWLHYGNTSVIVKSLSPEAIWQAPTFPSPKENLDEFIVHCQQKIAALVHLKPLQMDLNDYLDFESSNRHH